MLQKQFGGCGVGFVTITSMTSGYRPTVRHTFGGWSSHAVTDSIYFDKKKQGISGHYFVPRNGAYVELRGQNKYASLLDTCQRASIFFYNKDSVLLSARVNKGESKNYSLGPSDGLQQVQVDEMCIRDRFYAMLKQLRGRFPKERSSKMRHAIIHPETW